MAVVGFVVDTSQLINLLIKPKDVKRRVIENSNRKRIIMSRTKRNDMGKEIVRDGKAYRAMDERLDPWNKEYYHTKGMKKKRYKEMQWELEHTSCCTMEFDVNEFPLVYIIIQRYITCPLCHHVFSELIIKDHIDDHISNIYLRTIDTKSLKTISSC